MDKQIISNPRRYQTSKHARDAYLNSVSVQSAQKETLPTPEVGMVPVYILVGNTAHVGEFMESVSSNYPGYFSQNGGDDDAYKATLISHAGASVERNQDAGFAHLGRQQVNRDVLKTSRDTDVAVLTSRYELAGQIKDFEIRSLDRHSDVRAELSALRSEQQAARIEQLRAEAGDSKFAALLKAVEKLAVK